MRTNYLLALILVVLLQGIVMASCGYDPPPDPPCTTPGIFHLTSPENASSQSTDSVTLSWETSTYADFYGIYLDTSPTPNTWRTSTTSTNWAVSSGILQPGTTYYWRIIACNTGSGCTTSCRMSAETFSFTTQPLAPHAILTIEPNYVIAGGSVLLDGHASHAHFTGGTITQYEWKWDSPTTPTTFDYNETSTSYADGAFDGNTVHTYTSAGTYKAWIRVTDSYSSTHWDTTSVDVNVSPDSDGDNMPDAWESKYELTDPNTDKDDDGLSNLQEYLHSTDPNLADTDGDGMPDGWEVNCDLNPLVNDANDDIDDDGMTNLQEYISGRVPYDNWPIEVTSAIDANTAVTNPVDLAIAPDSNVYVLSSSQHQVKIYNNQLQLQSTLDVNAINPKGLAVDANNHIYIADTGNNRILKYEPNGTLDTNFGTNGSGDGQFSQPQGIALDWSGKIYVADSNNNRVQIFDSNGTFVAKWGQFGVSDGNLSNPSGLCLLGNNEIFVADTNNNRIQRLNSQSGYFLSKVGSLGSGYTQFNAPHGICYDIAFDQIIVADSSNNRLQIFQLHSYGGNSSPEMTFAKAISDQNFLNPMAVACKYDPNDPNQIIFVADTGNNRILKLRIQNDQQNNSPLGIFNTFKAALYANNVNAAIDCFTDTAKETYSVVLPQLQSKFSEMVSDMGQMILISLDEYTAVYDLLREEDGQMFGYPVAFSRDEMGNWKISKF